MSTRLPFREEFSAMPPRRPRAAEAEAGTAAASAGGSRSRCRDDGDHMIAAAVLETLAAASEAAASEAAPSSPRPEPVMLQAQATMTPQSAPPLADPRPRSPLPYPPRVFLAPVIRDSAAGAEARERSFVELAVAALGDTRGPWENWGGAGGAAASPSESLLRFLRFLVREYGGGGDLLWCEAYRYYTGPGYLGGRYAWSESVIQACFRALPEGVMNDLFDGILEEHPQILAKTGGPHGSSLLHELVVASTRDDGRPLPIDRVLSFLSKPIPVSNETACATAVAHPEAAMASSRDCSSAAATATAAAYSTAEAVLAIHDDRGRTPLHLAFGKLGNRPMHLPSLQALARAHPAGLAVSDKSGMTPLMAAFQAFHDGTGTGGGGLRAPQPSLVSVLLEMIRLCPESVRGNVRRRDGSAGLTSALELACRHCPGHPELVGATLDACPLALCDGGLPGPLTGLPREIAPMVKSEAFAVSLAVLEAAFHKRARDAVPESIRRRILSSLESNLRAPLPVRALALRRHEVATFVQEHVHGDGDRDRLRSIVLGGEAIQRLLARWDFREFVLDIYRLNRARRSGYESLRYPGFPPRIPGSRTGGGGAAEAAAEEASAVERLKCIACLFSDRTQVFLPCGHMCACDDCASWILGFDDAAKCPCCRSHVQSSLKVYLS